MTLKLGKPISRDWSLNLRQKSYHLHPTYLRWASGKGPEPASWRTASDSDPISHVGGGSVPQSNSGTGIGQACRVGETI